MKYYDPKIPREEKVQILDMNFLANPKWYIHAYNLNKNNCKTELICGIDHRLLDKETAMVLHKFGFIKMRWAWDYSFASGQKKHQRIWKMFLKAGYKSEELSIFILVNWKIPYVDCVKKLDLLKIWNVKVNDCCWDGGYRKAKATFWTPEQMKRFRAMCRKHNQMVLFKIDPEIK